MKQFFKDLGITQTRGFVRLSNTFNTLTDEEKKTAVLAGIKRFPDAPLTTRQIWLYFNSFLKDKESITEPEKVAVMGCNEATEARNKAVTSVSNEIIKNRENPILQGLRNKIVFKG
jgi:hypothetical protein